MKHLLLSLAMVIVPWLPIAADDESEKKGPAASELLSTALTQAKAEAKPVFLVFGSPGCGWCAKFEKYHADPDVALVIKKHLVLVKVDIVKNPGGDELYKKYGTERGVPAFTILDADAHVLADSGDGKENIGFPAEPKEVEHYFKALRKCCPKLTDGEVELLTAKLKELMPKKGE